MIKYMFLVTMFCKLHIKPWNWLYIKHYSTLKVELNQKTLLQSVFNIPYLNKFKLLAQSSKTAPCVFYLFTFSSTAKVTLLAAWVSSYTVGLMTLGIGGLVPLMINLLKTSVKSLKAGSSLSSASTSFKWKVNQQSSVNTRNHCTYKQKCTLMGNSHCKVGIWIPDIWIPETFKYWNFHNPMTSTQARLLPDYCSPITYRTGPVIRSPL